MSNAADASKRAKRDHAREIAREMREKEQKRKRRNRLFIQGGVGVGILAIIGVIVLVITSTTATAPVGPGPKNMASDGILLTGNGTTISAVKTAAIKANGKPVATDESKYASTVNVVTYIDYQCPYCEQFESTNAANLEAWVKSGAITLEIHPIAFLDASSEGNKYSTRAANAAACVAQYDPDDYLAFNTAMYENQPAEDTQGMTDAALKKIVTGAGVTSSKVSDCISNKTFVSWTAAETNRVLAARTTANGGDGATMPNSGGANFGGTPFILIDGTQYSGSITDASTFETAIATAAAAKGLTGTSTAVPTPTPTATN